jgi:hypothetical protein
MQTKDVDGRDKPGHDETASTANALDFGARSRALMLDGGRLVLGG